MADEQSFPTTRGLIDADVGPLRRFTGVFDSMPREKQIYGEGEKKRESWRVSLNFKNIEILEAIESYAFPTFTIQITQSNKRKSRWGYFSEGKPDDKVIGFNNIVDMQYSAAQLDPSNPEYVKPQNRTDLKNCFGKRFGLVLADGEESRPKAPLLFDGRADDGKGADVSTPAWTVYMVEGMGIAGSQGITPMEKAMQMLDGKTIQQFNDAALAEPLVREDTNLLQSISLPTSAPNSFTTMMLTSGQFTKDEATGIFKRVLVT